MTVTSIISYLGEGLLSARPADPGVPADTVAFYYATDVPLLYAWNGAAWVGASGVSGEKWSYTLSYGGGSVAQNGTIVIEGYLQAAAHVLGVAWDVGSGGGSATAAFQINTTPITGLSAVAISTTGTANASAANAMAAHDTLRIVLSGVSGAIADGSKISPFGTYD